MRLPAAALLTAFSLLLLLLTSFGPAPAYSDDVAPQQAGAQTAPAQPAPAQGAPAGNPQLNTPFQFIFSTVNYFLIAFFVYYILVLRPSQLKEEDHSRFLKDVKRDDEVITSGGIIGRVAAVQSEFISVEIASGVKVRVRPEDVSPFPANPGAKKSAGVEPRLDGKAKQPVEKERKSK